MTGAIITRDTSCTLASYIEDRRRGIVSSVVRSSALSRPGDVAAVVFANAFIDRLCQELEIGDGDIVNIWVDSETSATDAAEQARIVMITCATISSFYVTDCGHNDEVVSYLAVRSSELEKRFHRDAIRTASIDPAKFVSRDEVVASLLSAIDARDAATCDHSRAVGMWSGRIAKTMGLSAAQQNVAILAGTLHDIGKIATPTEILLKAGPLDEAEWEVMRAHSRIGAKMLERIPSLAELAPIVLAHHERPDGTGYPDRLVTKDIPIIARIISVADSFHAMISKRPYRQSMPVLRALDVLRAGAGTQWDSDVIDTMIGVVRPVEVERPVELRKVVGGSNY
jgi:putative nucleotidyltransferase with HDIG domain